MTAICTVLLAAGSSSRFGGIKLLAPIDGAPMIRGAAQAALDAGTTLVIVTGAHVAALDAELSRLPAARVHNADWALGMGTSIACAFRHLLSIPRPPDAALISLADQPLVRSAQLQRLIDVHRAAPQCIVAAAYADTIGPPCLFPQRYFAELAQLSGPRGARSVLDAHGEAVRTLDVPEAAVDIDTVDEYRRVVDTRPGRTPSAPPL